MIWDGDTWLCEDCATYNAVIRKKCRTCGASDPGPYHDELEINAEVLADVREAVEHDYRLGLGRDDERDITGDAWPNTADPCKVLVRPHLATLPCRLGVTAGRANDRHGLGE